MRTYELNLDRTAGARHAVRQILLCWLISTFIALLIWQKDVDLTLESVLTLLVIGAIAAVPLWFLFRIFRFAFSR